MNKKVFEKKYEYLKEIYHKKFKNIFRAVPKENPMNNYGFV